jgi:hypothetical protein
MVIIKLNRNAEHARFGPRELPGFAQRVAGDSC